MNKLKVTCMLIVTLLAGCTQQQMAKHWGGTSDINLPANQKFVGATWEEDNLWYVTRPMRPGEKPETYTMTESSSYGMFQGKIVIHEQ